MKIETRITRLLGIDLPIVQAGMSWVSSGSALPLAVSRAGGLGVIAAGPMRPDELAQAIDDVRAGTDRPFAVNVPLSRKGIAEIMDLLESRRVPILIASQGGPRGHLARFRDIGTTWLHVVASEEHAGKAIAAGVDGLVVVGAEAGGHPPPSLVSTLVVGRAVARAVPDVPMILGGGIADGYGLAAALALGADAAQIGTRFMLTPEARLHPTYRERIRAAGVTDTLVVGHGFGVVRVLKNTFSERLAEAERSGVPEEERRALFQAATLKLAAFDGDLDAGKIEAGQSVGLASEILPAAEIVQQIVEDYVRATARMPPVMRLQA